MALAAFLGGVLTLLAPCSVMVLPAFFAYAFTSPRALLGRTAVYWLGLLTTLLPLGVLAGSLGALLRQHMTTATLLGGIAVIILGVLQALSIPLHLPGLARGGAPAARRNAASPLSVYLLGALAGLAGVGCAGPILGSVLVLAGLGGSPARAAALMVLYSLGMVLPLVVLALAWSRLGSASRSWLRPRTVTLAGRTTTWTELIGGALCVALGGLMVVVGPSGLNGGLVSARTLADAEQQVLAAAGAVPAWPLAMLAAALLALAVLLIARRR
ncbi:cytochrome c biogenesis CcdA family protein [Actinomyces capricornis]|uniref:Integral membrane cytochrome c biogenesis protein n=1 Tax=Actinomyces capricornis TaxID=2755559 RepID=A0ABM7UA24_9ACTO|nr:cytochrome c biogenesis CcdA family protein [Actinomyces capricornis]BDA64243.1 putative integral membrane cytochrome c biogenesis protein [Actinomyces capricornis]